MEAETRGVTKDTDRIEKSVVVKTPRSRVWRAVTTAEEFGEWFGVKLEGEFAVGQTIHGRITNPGYEHLQFTMQIQTLAPDTLFAYRWHPYAVDPNVDYSSEPTTLVQFRLSDGPEGTLVEMVETGFDAIPAHRRDEAFRMHDRGWTEQTRRIAGYVEHS